MPDMANDFLRLLQGAHVQIFNLQIVHVPLADTFLLHLAELRKLSFHFITKLPHLKGVFIIARLYHATHFAHQLFHLFPNRLELFHIFRRHGIEIVVHMFQTRLAHALQAIQTLLAAIAGKMEPRVFLHGLQGIYLAQPHQFLAPDDFPVLPLVVQAVQCAAQDFHVFRNQPVRSLTICVRDIFHHARLVTADMLVQQSPRLVLIIGLCQSRENLVLLHGCHPLLVTPVVPNQHTNNNHHQQDHGHQPAEMDEQRDDKTKEKRSTGRHEPTANHGNDSRHTEYGTLTPPSTIRQRGTHAHHEGHISG